jgi:hypothetical protein
VLLSDNPGLDSIWQTIRHYRRLRLTRKVGVPCLPQHLQGGNGMKEVLLTLCVLIALSSLAHAASFYKCVDSRGNVIMTDNPPPDAKCEGISGGADGVIYPQSDPRERQRIEKERLGRETAEQLFSRVKKGMSQVDVKKILGSPFHSEISQRGSNHYVEKWIYPRDGEADCIVRFFCATKCSVTAVIK